MHLSSITAAATIGATGELVRAKLPGDVVGVVDWVRELPGERKRVTYEAGPCGFGLARALTMSGVDVAGRAVGRSGVGRHGAWALNASTSSGQRIEVFRHDCR